MTSSLTNPITLRTRFEFVTWKTNYHTEPTYLPVRLTHTLVGLLPYFQSFYPNCPCMTRREKERTTDGQRGCAYMVRNVFAYPPCIRRIHSNPRVFIGAAAMRGRARTERYEWRIATKAVFAQLSWDQQSNNGRLHLHW